MLNTQKFVLTLITTFMASAPTAYAADFNFTEKWSYKCNDTKSTIILEKLANIAVRDGLKTLEAINPTLFQTAILKAKNGYPLKWLCEDRIKASNYANAFFTSYERTDGTFESITLTPDGLQNIYKATRADATITQVNTALATLFHEYLHYLGFDSVSPIEHTYSPFTSGQWPVDVTRDVVVACAAQAFPGHRIVEVREMNPTSVINASKMNGRLSDPVYEVMSRSQASCESCARARAGGPNSTYLTENPNEILNAQIACEKNTYEKVHRLARRTANGQWRVLP